MNSRPALVAIFALSFAACGDAKSKPAAAQATEPAADVKPAADAKPATPAPTLSELLIPTLSARMPTAATPSARWHPATIFSVPVRPWLPPAESAEKPRVVPGDQRIPATAPFSLPTAPLPSPDIAVPTPLVLPATAREFSIGPNPAHITVRIATNPTPDTRGRPPAWDRPQLATDPTEAIIRTAPLATPTGLRETPPPFLRVSLPDPFEQINIAELRPPPPETDAPVASFFRPPVSLPVAPAAK
ncbi:MAG: hypothetical protein DVB27_01235 [Verrucomicrobia bacterium]|nr:MAG: hypothetical protein DVB27_01235 [Verrucomicrobiota bacterium]